MKTGLRALSLATLVMVESTAYGAVIPPAEIVSSFQQYIPVNGFHTHAEPIPKPEKTLNKLSTRELEVWDQKYASLIESLENMEQLPQLAKDYFQAQQRYLTTVQNKYLNIKGSETDLELVVNSFKQAIDVCTNVLSSIKEGDIALVKHPAPHYMIALAMTSFKEKYSERFQKDLEQNAYPELVEAKAALDEAKRKFEPVLNILVYEGTSIDQVEKLREGIRQELERR